MRFVALVGLCSAAVAACSSGDSGGASDAGAAGGTSAPLDDVTEGDFSRFGNYGWIDMHVHLHSAEKIDPYVAYQDEFGMAQMVLLSLPRWRVFETQGVPTNNPELLLARVRHPTRFRIFGTHDLTRIVGMTASEAKAELGRQTEQLYQAGFEGLKLHMGEQDVAHVAQISGLEYFPDGELMEEVFQVATARGMPVLIHIDTSLAAHGQAALERYPAITWLVTHMAFSPYQLDSLEQVLLASDHVTIDAGHYVHLGPIFSHPNGEGAEFIKRYASRFLASTDLGAGCDLADLAPEECPTDGLATTDAWKLRALLETIQPVSWIDVYPAHVGDQTTVNGAGLDPATLEQLYRANAVGLLPTPERDVDCAAAVAHIDELISSATDAVDIARVVAIRDEIEQTAGCP
jgi:hypothetical protein